MSTAPGALILATSATTDVRWVELLQRYLQSGSERGYPLVVLVAPDSALLRVDARPGLRVLAYASEPGGKLARAWRLFLELRRLDAQAPLHIVAADDDVEHWAAAAFKLCSRHPVAVLKTRFDAEPLPNTRLNRWLDNRLTAANLFLSAEAEGVMRQRRKRHRLWMDNPCVLVQPRLGDPHGDRMLEHAFVALLQPTRNDPMTEARRDLSHIGLAYVTHFYLNQDGKAAVLDLLRRYAGYDPALLDRIHFVIVDDGSPVRCAPPDLPLNLTWLRVRQDIPWNQAGARNLGAVYARCDKMLVTDVDHEFPEEVLRRMVERGSCGKRISKFWRRGADGGYYHCHPNTFFLSRGRYFELYGYDEEFAGAYGAEDVRFMKYQKAHGSLAMYLSKKYWCLERTDIDRGKAYHSLKRDHSVNTPVDSRKRLELEWYGPAAGHSRAFLSFEWDLLVQRWRDFHGAAPPTRRWWKRLTPLRQILPRF